MNLTIRSIPILLVLLLLAACEEQSRIPASGAGYSQQQAADVEAVHHEIDAHYDSLMTHYMQMNAELSPQLHEQYAQIEQMHHELEPMHQMVMSGGMMHHEMMDEEMTASSVDDSLADWDRMHTMHRRLMTMHHALSDSLYHHGYVQMADMHDQMATLLREATELTNTNR